MANRWLMAVALAVVCVLSGGPLTVSAEGGSSGILDLSNGGYKIDVLRQSELLKHGDPAQWEEINLSGNSIDEVDDNTFIGFRNLKKLSLSGNALPTIEDHWFKGSTLQSLDLSKNVLVAIRSDALSGLTDLQELNLASNLLRPFKPNTFDHTPNLKRLVMKNNPKVQEMFLNVTIPSLEELNLQTCRVNNIASLHLESLPNLKHIDLKGNVVNQLDEGAFTGNAKLTEVDLRDNFLDELRGNQLKKAFSTGSKVVVHFDLHDDTCVNCNAHACASDLELQTFICQKTNESTFKDTFEWSDAEKDLKVTLKAHPGKTE